MKIFNILKIIKEKTMEKKHIKKIKPKTSTAATFGSGNGGNPCPPIGGDVLTPEN